MAPNMHLSVQPDIHLNHRIYLQHTSLMTYTMHSGHVYDSCNRYKAAVVMLT